MPARDAQQRRMAAAAAAYREWCRSTGQKSAELRTESPDVRDMWLRIQAATCSAYINFSRRDLA